MPATVIPAAECQIVADAIGGMARGFFMRMNARDPEPAFPVQHASSIDARQRILEQWASIKKQAPGKRESFLRSTEVIAAIGAVKCAALRRQLNVVRRKLELRVPSGAWLDGAYHGGEAFPPAGMVKSRQLSRHGDGRPHWRWTPPQCVAQEDYLDGMTPHEAELDQFRFDAPSISAVVIGRIAMSKARPVDGLW